MIEQFMTTIDGTGEKMKSSVFVCVAIPVLLLVPFLSSFSFFFLFFLFFPSLGFFVFHLDRL